ncbi:N-acetylglucosamine/diacetylchitobiose ABC transporter substrate-binding protein [Streptomyces somaliensis DSM 40738]|uniref:Carbohydrate ABC transporter, N-acetylglucosamine/diacetylchitobiose-binding protein n=1 Tax=Streptomyces somaliensis (strain ATCC 33201 / DSM 40738 / JCM 12659 / KCTC 9044 / NCTC 11332 / NRRL B-12077 / IP 733) TaxID=1134445 RepID=A0AA44DBA1_STRE0|nr:N-acetylglucosamine/diacetylchitobiose ABC transporter substrate-binding protein [Streptomyces somaliensis]MCQ0025082.1 N-acetylglucosamine/diacetylchitobiose ABC transporter substrate-binding protein [Streptomyces somaliensis DSM 40738]NKY13137.1 carbohydrate ABC transporter, N-acetylglucosamine/diacetylchitobiose-binding protein [Streptomyces somaliensis DSM 40738]
MGSTSAPDGDPTPAGAAGRARPGRRDLIRRSAALGLAAVPVTGLLSACATGGGGGTGGGGTAATGEKTAKNPLGVKEGAPLEVFVFKGGLGDQYAKDAEADYRAAYGAEVKHTGTQQVGPKLTPRFAGGNPPDVIDNSGADHLDMNKLSTQGQLQDLAALLDAPSLDDPARKVRDTIHPSTLEKGLHGGRFDVLYYAFTVYGTWYSRKLLDSRGWAYPKTLDEMVALCGEIRKAGLAPWTYAGKYPYYVHFNLFGQIAKIGGMERWTAIDNLEPNAWTSNDAVRQVAEHYEELAAKKYFLEGSQGLTHIQSQTAWNKGKAVFLPNGSWVENESAPTTPRDFGMSVGPLFDGDGDELPHGTLRAEPSEPYVVAAKGGNPVGGMELLRIMLSRKHARNFATKVKSLTCVVDATEGMALSPGLASADRAFRAAGGNLVNLQLQEWYPTLTDQKIGGLTGQLLTGEIRAADWIRGTQAAADKVARDPSVTKFERTA